MLPPCVKLYDVTLLSIEILKVEPAVTQLPSDVFEVDLIMLVKLPTRVLLQRNVHVLLYFAIQKLVGLNNNANRLFPQCL
jgi:hypothetical protein